jgi:hypothetical protein
MFRGVLRRLAARLGGDRDEEASDDERFVPSILDASVRHAHGGGDAEVERELAAVDEQARRLEEERRER